MRNGLRKHPTPVTAWCAPRYCASVAAAIWVTSSPTARNPPVSATASTRFRCVCRPNENFCEGGLTGCRVLHKMRVSSDAEHLISKGFLEKRRKLEGSTSRSSRGLGHRPFTAVTGVRLPYGTPLPHFAQSGNSSVGRAQPCQG